MSDNTSKQSWSVGITCYNEEATIEKVALQLIDVLSQIASHYEIIIVDDCSTDNSKSLVEKLVAEHPQIKAIYHEVNQGIGRTISDVYFNSKYENLTYVPGDAQFDAEELLLVGFIEEKTYISFYRRKQNMAYSNFRSFMSFLNKSVNSFFIGLDLKDVNWVNVYKREEIENLNIQIRSSIIVSEICAKLNLIGYKAIEIESIYHPRIYGKPQGASLKNIIDVGFETLKLISILHKFRKSVQSIRD